MNAPRLILSGGVLADGTRSDVGIDPLSGTVSEVAPALEAEPGDTVEDCTGMVILAAPAEPHAHLDKALSAMAAANPVGDLAGAIDAWHSHRAKLTHDDLVVRATTALKAMVAAGTTAIRTHVDVGEGIGLMAVDALCEVRDAFRGLADLQIVALVGTPLSGSAGAENRRWLDAALDAGADAAGGCPYRDDDPAAATKVALDAAERFGAALDLHTDETIDPGVLTLPELARQAGERGLSAPVTASHCVSLGMQPPDVQQAVAEALADAGVSVVCLPQTNLYLQARQVSSAPPRGLTALRALIDAGVVVAGGADNVRDPFCSMGRLDATETAALLAMAGHLRPSEAWEACTSAARSVMGLAPAAVEAGSAAEVVAIEGGDLADALAAGSARRITIHRGHVVARTSVSTTLSRIPETLEV